MLPHRSASAVAAYACMRAACCWPTREKKNPSGNGNDHVIGQTTTAMVPAAAVDHDYRHTMQPPIPVNIQNETSKREKSTQAKKRERYNTASQNALSLSLYFSFSVSLGTSIHNAPRRLFFLISLFSLLSIRFSIYSIQVYNARRATHI